MPNRDAIHAQSKHERWPIATPYMPNRNIFIYFVISFVLCLFIYGYLCFFVCLYIYIRKEV